MDTSHHPGQHNPATPPDQYTARALSWLVDVVSRFVLPALQRIEQRIEKMARTLDEVLADVTDEGTQIDSLVTLVNGIEQQLKDALSGTTLPPAVQAKVDAVFDAVEANKSKVVAAINANTQPAP